MFPFRSGSRVGYHTPGTVRNSGQPGSRRTPYDSTSSETPALDTAVILGH